MFLCIRPNFLRRQYYGVIWPKNAHFCAKRIGVTKVKIFIFQFEKHELSADNRKAINLIAANLLLNQSIVERYAN